MIDMHVHILPGIDDGPETLEEALALAQMLIQDNVHGAVATPHYNDEYPQRSAAEIQGRVDDLQREFQRLSIPLRLFAGHEALIKPGLVEDIQYGRLATLNHSHYLLLELWDNAWLPGTERTLFELRACGIVPILAHPERCRVFQREPQRLAALLQQGVLTQLTASSLLGIQGQTARRSAESLLKKGLIHCIASDAHGARKRPPALSQSLKRATQLIGDEKVQKATENYPLLIVNDKPYKC